MGRNSRAKDSPTNTNGAPKAYRHCRRRRTGEQKDLRLRHKHRLMMLSQKKADRKPYCTSVTMTQHQPPVSARYAVSPDRATTSVTWQSAVIEICEKLYLDRSNIYTYN